MMKKILSFFMLFVCVPNLQAQETNSNGVWWGNYTGSQQTGLKGNSQLGTYQVATFVAGDDDLQGASISSIRAQMRLYSNSINCKFWVRDSLNGENKVEKEFTPTNGWAEASLDEAVTIPADGLYVGYSFTLNGWYSDYDYTPVVYAKRPVRKSFYLIQPGTNEWVNNSSEGCSTIQLLLNGGNLKVNSAKLENNLSDIIGLVGNPIPITLTITNLGQGISSIDYQYMIDGAEKTNHIDLDPAIDNMYGEQRTLDVTLEGPATAGTQAITITLTKVNGEDNENTENVSADLTLNILEESAPRKALVETYLGHNASYYYTPRAIVGMEKMKQALGDNIVSIGVHKKDELSIETYANLADAQKTVPISVINRSRTTDPYFGDAVSGPYHFTADSIVNATLSDVCEAVVDVTAQWEAEDKSKASAHVTVDFLYTTDAANYRLAFVALEDSIAGKTYNYMCYAPANYPDDDMSVYCNGSWEMDCIYNDVAIASSEVKGISKSIPSTIVKGEPVTYEYMMDIPDAGGKNTRIAVLLINYATGKVVNADVAAIEDNPALGIQEVSSLSANSDVQIYTIDGKQIYAGKYSSSNLAPGLYVIKSGNTVSKMLVK